MRSEAPVPGRAPAGPVIAALLSDERLYRRARAGEERAFAAIFRRYHQRLYRYCLAILGNPEDAEDALQSTMVKALRSLPGEERQIELRPWLYRVAHNEAIDLLRRRREGEPLDPELAATGAGLAVEAEARERLRQLLADVGQLSERQRGALLMRELAGLDFEQIGAALGTSAAVARQTLYEARLGLRQFDAGREMGCREVMRALSDGDGRMSRRRDIRAHLLSCANCRHFHEEIARRGRDLGALSPLPALTAAGILQGLLGGSGGGTGGGAIAGALGGGAAKSLGASVALKGAAAVAVVAAVGTVAADRGGLIDTGVPGGSPARERPAATGGESGGSGERAGAGTASATVRAIHGAVANGRPQPRAGLAAGLAVKRKAGHDSGGGSESEGSAAAGGNQSGQGSLPVAASHRQSTAAARKSAAQGSSGARGSSGVRGSSGARGHPGGHGNSGGRGNSSGRGRDHAAARGHGNGHPSDGAQPQGPAHPSPPAKPSHAATGEKPPQATAPPSPPGPKASGKAQLKAAPKTSEAQPEAAPPASENGVAADDKH